MPNGIQEDFDDFQQIIGGKKREELKRHIQTGEIFGQRPNGRGALSIPIKRIELPYITHGEEKDGVGSGPGKPGDVIGKKPGKGDGKGGHKPGTNPGEGMLVDVDMEEIWKELQEELKLPNMQPKDTPTWEDIEVKYNGISRLGPRSLLHPRRTFKECLKREIAQTGGKLEKKIVPGCNRPVTVFHPIKDDFRYRQYNEIKKPSSNAAIFFVRDGSGSMDDNKCEIVSDVSFWIDAWIRRFYKTTKKIYVWHDTEAKELSEKKFYNLRYGGGTYATSAMEFVERQLYHRVPPQKWNIYVFYFGDGETFGRDNDAFVELLKTKLGPQAINLTGVVQILSYSYTGTLKHSIDLALESGKLDKKFVRTVSVGDEKDHGYGSYQTMTPEQKGQAVKKAISALLGAKATETTAKA
jgi:uncharacterized sporulation protein YeaH/YhbH (DUF444 family)